MIASYPVLVLSALDKRQKFAYAELKNIPRPCYSVYSRLQSLRCLWSCGLNLVPMAFPGYANEVDEVGETLVTLWILWRLLIGREWRSTFSMTSQKHFIVRSVNLSFNYELKSKYLWTTPCNISSEIFCLIFWQIRIAGESKRHFTSFPCPYWSRRFKQRKSTVKGNQTIANFSLFFNFTSLANYL